MASLVFSPGDGGGQLSIPLSISSSVLVAIMKSGAFIRHDCGGKALCGTCRIEVGEGGRLSPMGASERGRLEAIGVSVDGRTRLACQTHASRDFEARGCLGKEHR